MGKAGGEKLGKSSHLGPLVILLSDSNQLLPFNSSVSKMEYLPSLKKVSGQVWHEDRRAGAGEIEQQVRKSLALFAADPD